MATGTCRVCHKAIHTRKNGVTWVHSDNKTQHLKPYRHFAAPGGSAKRRTAKTASPRTNAGTFNIFGIRSN